MGCPDKDIATDVPFVVTDMDNIMYNSARDVEQLTTRASQQEAPSKRPFDWFILSVLGYLCFPFTGMCAMYYAYRANHGVDWNLNKSLVASHTRKASILSIFSILLGLFIIATIIGLFLFFIYWTETGYQQPVYDYSRDYNWNSTTEEYYYG